MSCGRTIGHGETCQPNYLCGTCERIAELEAENKQLSLDYISAVGQAQESLERIAELEQKLKELRGDLEITELRLAAAWRDLK